MKARTELVLALALLALLLGVGLFVYSTQSRNSVQVFHATVDRDCAPWDGPAFRISIPLDSRSVIEIAIWRSPDAGAPVRFSFPDPVGSVGDAVYRPRSGVSEPLTGRVTFWRLGEAIPVEG